MQSVIISVAVGLLAFAMGLVGLYLKRRLPERHMSTGSRDMIGAIMGLLSLLLALVLGTLVGSAHQFFTSQKAELESLGARSLELELAFRQYGPETEPLRQMMKTSVQEAHDAAQGNRKAYEQHFEIGDYLSKFEKWNDMVASLAPRTPGEITGGRAHLDRAIALYDPAEHRHLAMRFGQDVGAASLCWRSLALLLLGYPQDALADAVRALKIARESRHSGTLIYVLNFSIFPHVYCGHFAAANALIDEFDILKDQIGSVFWGGWGTVQRGCVLALTGKVTEAVQNIASGIAEMRSTGTTLWMPLFLSYLALANAEVGQLDQAWANIHEAMSTLETTKENWYEAEINRVAGAIVLLGTEPDAVKAEAYFASALEIARKQKAKSWELRAAMSMARLWRDQGKREQAHDLLAPVYGWFTAGFDTIDLREAKSLLDGLVS